jgi:hypothetical protein
VHPHGRHRYQLAVAAVVTCWVLAGCDPSDVAQPPISTTPSVPAVAGQPLELAKSALLAVGFSGHSRDVLRDRVQLVDSNWTVCTQDPAPGPATRGTVVELGVVKDSEVCPAASQTTSATPVPTTILPPPTTTPAAAPAPRPAPKPAPKPAPAPPPVLVPEPADPPANDDSGGLPSVGTVHAGSFCSPAGSTGLSSTGKPMVCGPGSDGKNRWHGA